MKYLIAFLYLFCLINVFAQQTNPLVLGTCASDYGRDLVVDDAGNFFKLSFTYDIWNGDNRQYPRITRLDANNDPVWTKALFQDSLWYTTEAFAMEYYDDALFITGYGYRLPEYYRGMMVARLDTAGNVEWMKFYDEGVGRDLSVSAAGIYVTGENGVLPTPRDMCVMKLDLDGNFLWKRGFTQNNDCGGMDILEAADGNVVAAGFLRQNDEFWRTAVVRLSPDGDVLWERFYSPLTSAVGTTIEETDSGYLVAGVSGVAPDQNAFLMKVAPGDGHVLWRKTYDFGPINNGGIFRDIAVVPSGLILAGASRIDASASLEIVIVKAGFDGTPFWAKVYGDDENNDVMKVLPLPHGLIGVGYTQHHFMPTFTGTDDYTFLLTDDAGNSPVFRFDLNDMVVTDIPQTIDSTGLITWLYTPMEEEIPLVDSLILSLDTASCLSVAGIEETAAEAPKVYPNPASELLHVEFADDGHAEQFILRDAGGREVMRQTEPELYVGGLAPGIYLLEMVTDRRIYITRVCIKP